MATSSTDTPASSTDTIAAIATPPGRGGVGIVRISGPGATVIGCAITRRELAPRHASYGPFYETACDRKSAENLAPLDHGIALFFPGPHSFTGEDVIELQGHGGPIILDCLLREVMRLGARLARPGEFSERAFLNDKLDLAQAEAIADLIDSASEQAARNAVRSLTGDFSRAIDILLEQLIALRLYVEAAIDFPEEEIDFIGDGKIAAALQALITAVDKVLHTARQGSLLREGLTVVIAGAPNAGKSSLLNALAGRDRAIVTPIAGTTRDVLREHIQIDGLPLHIIDTAGLRDSPDEIEQEGIRRAWREIDKADHILLMVDSSDAATCNLNDPATLWPQIGIAELQRLPITIVRNKCDLSGVGAGVETEPTCVITLSAKTGDGIELLREHLKQRAGYTQAGEGGFSARRRHLDALERTLTFLHAGELQLQHRGAGELLAEDLRQAQQALGEITGKFTPDDLLGRIFSSFCIGK
ncbi:MAG: tRNA uridine-5-carboxymethylaminomethyl(34) synthesis GTPase MnmE [Spongiibacteraceae bacterium]